MTIDSMEVQRLGAFRLLIVRNQFISTRPNGMGRREAARAFDQLEDDDILGAVVTVAASKDISISAIGDGTFLQFLIDNWEEILKIILMLIGI